MQDYVGSHYRKAKVELSNDRQACHDRSQHAVPDINYELSAEHIH